jgi:phage-related minor tail protein
MQNDRIDLRTEQLRDEMQDLSRLADSFGQKLVTGLASAVTQGRKLSDVMRGIALSIANQALSQALRPVGDLVGNLLGGLTGSLAGGVKPFADGGVVNSPLLFPLKGGTGLAGEAGPEAIIPLARGADGKLGVRGGSGGARVTVNISTPDAESFKQSRGQVAALMSRALSRGERNL